MVLYIITTGGYSMANLPSVLEPIRNDSSDKKSDRKLEITFGNGYVQRGANGINTIIRNVSISFIGSTTDIQTYIDFFDNLKGYQNFQWTHPKESTERNWVVGDRTVTDLSNDLRKLTTTFILDYSLAS